MQKTTLRYILPLILLLLLAGCNLPTSRVTTPTPQEDLVATQVAQLLTANPTFTAPASTASAAPVEPTITPVPATATPEQTTPTQEQAATATSFPSGDPRNTLGQPTWRDNLDTSASFSYLYENEGTRVSHEPGALLLTGRTANGWMGWTLTFKQQPQNFYLEAVFNTPSCSGGDTYGIVFRAPDTEAGYFYGVTCDGRYYLDSHDFSDNSGEEIIRATANNAIQTGAATNRLGVMAVGDKISLYANGVLLQEVTNANYTEEGYFGAFVAANATPDFTVRLDEVLLWTLP